MTDMIYVAFHALANMATALGMCFFARNLIEWKEQYRRKRWILAAGYIITAGLTNIWWDKWIVFLVVHIIFGGFVLSSGVSMRFSKVIRQIVITMLVCMICRVLTSLVYIQLYRDYFFQYKNEQMFHALLIVQGVIIYYVVIAVIRIVLNKKMIWGWMEMAALLCKDVVIVHLLFCVQRFFHRTVLIEWFGILVLALVEFLLFWRLTNRERENKQQTSGGYMPDASLYEYYTQMEEMHGVIRKLHHDMKNHLMVLEGVGEGSEENEYLTRLNDQLAEMDCFYNTGNVYLNVLLFEKHKAAESHNIKFEVRIEKDALNFINSADVCTIFGDALDNALEACMGRTGQYIEVKAGSMGSDIVIVIANTTDKTVSEGEGKQAIQSKKKNSFFHGIGISSIQATALRYSGRVKIAIKDGMFRMTIIIPQKSVPLGKRR